MNTTPLYDSELLLPYGPRRPQMPTRPPKTEKTTPAAVAVRAELRLVLETEPFGIAELVRMSEIAESGKQLLIATRVQDLEGVMQRTANGGLQFGGNGSIPSNPAETFGATAIRELQAALPKLLSNQRAPSPLALVRALAAATEEGLDDVAKDLREQLRVLTAGDPEPELAAPDPAVDSVLLTADGSAP